MGIGRIALAGALWGAAMGGLVLVLAPACLDFGTHWDLFVSRLNYFVPGFVLLTGGVVGLAILENKR